MPFGSNTIFFKFVLKIPKIGHKTPNLNARIFYNQKLGGSNLHPPATKFQINFAKGKINL